MSTKRPNALLGLAIGLACGLGLGLCLLVLLGESASFAAAIGTLLACVWGIWLLGDGKSEKETP